MPKGRSGAGAKAARGALAVYSFFKCMFGHRGSDWDYVDIQLSKGSSKSKS